jgi:hypothetical protein
MGTFTNGDLYSAISYAFKPLNQLVAEVTGFGNPWPSTASLIEFARINAER